MQTKSVWAEISEENLIKNYEYVRSAVGDNCKICAVVKADAYGHGSELVSHILDEAGVDMFAVARLEEAVKLRGCGIKKDILVLGRTDPEDCDTLANLDLIQGVYSYDYASELSGELKKSNLQLRIHIKLDTGMNRIGFSCKNADDTQVSVAQIVNISRLPFFKLEGIFSHFAMSDKKMDIFNAIQYRNFLTVCSKLQKLGIHSKIRHICNTDAIFNFPYCHMDMVRAGIALYGTEGGPNLRPVMSVKTSIIHIHTVNAGESVSYACAYKASHEMKLATLSIGYADGLPRAWSEKGYVLIGGKRAKIIGRICMDQCMVDVSDISCKVGDVATILGNDGIETLSAKRIAEAVGTISYEILCGFNAKRVEKV